MLSMVRRKTVLLVARRRRRVTLGHVPWSGTQAPQLEDREQQVALAVVHSRVVQLMEEVVHLENNIYQPAHPNCSISNGKIDIKCI